MSDVKVWLFGENERNEAIAKAVREGMPASMQKNILQFMDNYLPTMVIPAYPKVPPKGDGPTAPTAAQRAEIENAETVGDLKASNNGR